MPDHAPTSSHDTPPTELAAFIDHGWSQLLNAVHDRRHGFRLVTLATTTHDGSPTARTVVLRNALPDQRIIRMHTDARSPKCDEIDHNDRVCVLAYDPDRKLQLRLTGKATVLREGRTADDAWEAAQTSSRRCYLAPHPPSQPSDEPTANLPEALISRNPERDQTEPGRPVFAVIEVRVERAEVLHIAHNGHRRAAAVYTDATSGNTITRTWLTP